HQQRHCPGPPVRGSRARWPPRMVSSSLSAAAARARAPMKILFHSNAPWTATGYGQQVALFAPRLAEHAELALSAFYGLQGGRIRYGDLDVYPGIGGTYGDESVLGHARSFFGELRGGVVLTLLDVPALDARVWQRLDVACWLPVDHDPAPPAVRSFLAE